MWILSLRIDRIRGVSAAPGLLQRPLAGEEQPQHELAEMVAMFCFDVEMQQKEQLKRLQMRALARVIADMYVNVEIQ